MIQDELKEFVKENYSEKKEVIALYDIIKILNEGRFVNKENLLATLIAFISFNDNFINTISQGLILAEVNVNAHRFLNEQYEKQAPPMDELLSFTEELIDAATQKINKKGQGVPRLSKKALDALKIAYTRHDQEIQEIYNVQVYD